MQECLFLDNVQLTICKINGRLHAEEFINVRTKMELQEEKCS